MKLKELLNEEKVIADGIIISLIDEKNKPKIAAKKWLQGGWWQGYPLEETIELAEELFQDETPPRPKDPKVFRIFLNEVARLIGIKGVKETKKEIKSVKKDSTKLPKKEFKL